MKQFIRDIIQQRFLTKINWQFTLIFLTVSAIEMNAQSVAINTTGAAPNTSAMLDISSTGNGLLIPRIALTSISDNTTISAPATSLIIYNTSATATITPGYYFWDGSSWVRLVSGTGGGFSWNILGNTATNASINYVGTSDNINFTFRTNNIERMRIEGNKLNFLNNGSSIFLGTSAGEYDDLTNNNNIGIGFRAARSTYGTGDCIAIGANAMRDGPSANVAIGNSAQRSSGGANSVTIASNGSLTVGTYNVCFGVSTNTSSSVVVGSGITPVASSDNNVILGLAALTSSSASVNNIVLGTNAFNLVTSATRSIAIGANALDGAPSFTATDCIAIGGTNAVTAAGANSNNLMLGKSAGFSNLTSSGNVFLGYNAGYNETGSNKLYIENSNSATPLIYGDFSSNYVGINRVAAANALEVGGSASQSTATNWLANSDRKIKKNIQDIENALETIKKLNPVKFKYTEEWKNRNPYIKANDHYYYNFIAQEYEKIFPESVQGSGEYINGSRKEILQIDTYNSQIVLIKAIQEQQKMIEDLKIKINQNAKKIDRNMEVVLSQKEEIDLLQKKREAQIKYKLTALSSN